MLTAIKSSLTSPMTSWCQSLLLCFLHTQVTPSEDLKPLARWQHPITSPSWIPPFFGGILKNQSCRVEIEALLFISFFCCHLVTPQITGHVVLLLSAKHLSCCESGGIWFCTAADLIQGSESSLCSPKHLMHLLHPSTEKCLLLQSCWILALGEVLVCAYTSNPLSTIYYSAWIPGRWKLLLSWMNPCGYHKS